MNFDSLAKSIAQGDEKAFEKLYIKLYKLVFSVCFSILKIEATANDLSQETFISVWKNTKDFRGNGYKSWILKIAKNKSINYLQKQKREISVDFSEDPKFVNSESGDTDTETKVMLKFAIEKLCQQDREIVLLKNSGLKEREIAEHLGIPRGTVAWRYSEAIKILKKQVEG
ncbi:MAG: sigma-70 family RNA polymerase sigma factor [Clostridia bacterium]|nr:sigma-70 family RNA polymerase sigma factor [Clostridia bacterium]